jgi:hypothetical protein
LAATGIRRAPGPRRSDRGPTDVRSGRAGAAFRVRQAARGKRGGGHRPRRAAHRAGRVVAVPMASRARAEPMEVRGAVGVVEALNSAAVLPTTCDHTAVGRNTAPAAVSTGGAESAHFTPWDAVGRCGVGHASLLCLCRTRCRLLTLTPRPCTAPRTHEAPASVLAASARILRRPVPRRLSVGTTSLSKDEGIWRRWPRCQILPKRLRQPEERFDCSRLLPLWTGNTYFSFMHV